MSGIIYLNGSYLPAEDARISPFDRGFLFGDAVYEVVRYFNGQALGMAEHVERFARSLREINLTGADAAEMEGISESLVIRNDWPEALVYWQVSRGSTFKRRHLPPDVLAPTVFAAAEPAPSIEECTGPKVIEAITIPDIRWHRCDIKSVTLLPNVMARIEANAQGGAVEAIQHRRGLVSEGTATNVFVVRKGRLITPPAEGEDVSILHGITRRILMQDSKLEIHEEPIPVKSLPMAEEIIMTGTRTLAGSVTRLDGNPVGDGKPGPVAQRMHDSLVKAIRSATG